jgi:hypothetical protein
LRIQRNESLQSARIAGTEICYVPAPHLREGEDWHYAYISKIETMLTELEHDIVFAPEYPVLCQRPLDYMDLLFETGAYWEGAIYFLKSVLNQDNFLDAIERALSPNPERLPGEDWQLFAHVWNSHNQLEWLKAFLLRETAIRDWDIGISYDSGPQGIRRFSATSNHTEELDWLADFVERNESEQDAYPNPYFGGYNSLHLGFIIDEPF